MENREDILKELREISMAVATIGNRNVYNVPNGYFETLADTIIEKVQTASLPVSSVPYSMPAGYFNNLADNILNKIKAQEKPEAVPELPGEVFEELEQVAPLLNTISRKNVYSTPANYFQQFSVNIEPQQTQRAKVVSLKRFKPTWVSYLAAACVAGVLVVGAFMFRGDNKHTDITQPNIEQQVAGLSDDDINNYLNDHPAVNPEVTPSALEQIVPDIQPAIENMSTDSIKQYLDENSEPGEKRVTDI